MEAIFCGTINRAVGLGKSGFNDKDLFSISLSTELCGVTSTKITGIDVTDVIVGVPMLPVVCVAMVFPVSLGPSLSFLFLPLPSTL